MVFLILALGTIIFYASWQILEPINKRDFKTEEFYIEKGLGVKEISQKLKERGFIRSPFWFEVYVWFNKSGSALKAGKYALSRNINIPQMVEMFTGGKVIFNEVQLTFPEGFTLTQIKKRLLDGGVLLAETLDEKKVGDFQIQYKFFIDTPAEASLEGFLFPDTYRFKKDLKTEEIVKKFLDNFDKKITPELRAEISRQRKSIFEIIILASIIQQESLNEEEMPQIAGVFVKRLQNNMPLESDATINFITGKQDRQPLYEDLKINSPYNTYLNRGLPPGPICNPGLAAIKAAIYPQIGDYFYFLHPLDGLTIFSKTLEEHNKNKAKYLK